MTFVVKALKPQRMKVDAIRLELLSACHAEGRAQVNELKKTVGSWQNKPTFAHAISLAGGNISVLTGPEGGKPADIWNWIDKGTKRRVITAKRAPYLKFRRNYSAATSPGCFGSYPSGSYGDWVSKKSVIHPGIKARLWSETLQEKRQKIFAQAVIKAVQRGAQKLY